MTQPQQPEVPPVFVRHLNLPSGGSVEFHDPEDMTGEDHRRIVDTVRDDAGSISQAMDTAYATACLLVQTWDIPYTPKGTAYDPHQVPTPAEGGFDLLGKLRLRDYHAIISGIGPAVRMLFPKDSSPDQAATPGTPTGPANG